MVRLRLDIAYDGGSFHGFAAQRGGELPTVQSALEAALARLWQADDVRTSCAGRTDAGVHALAQVVHVDADPDNPRVQRMVADLEAARVALDRLTPDAVTIWRVRAVDAAFDARFSATERRYRYRIADVPALDPLERHRVWHRPRARLALRPMQRGAKLLLGEHDFSSFCRRSPGQHTVRRLDEVTVSRRDDGFVHVRMRGRAFCHQMVRSIVGCLAEVGEGRHEPAWIAEVLAARDRTVAAAVAPAHGLVLEGVRYGRRYPPAG